MWDNPFAGEWEMQNRVMDAHRQAAQNRELFGIKGPRKGQIWWSLVLLGSLLGFIVSRLGIA